MSSGERTRLRYGFSLIEVAVATAIILMIILGGMAAMAAATMQRRIAEEDRIAQDVIDSFVEDMQSRPLAEVLSTTELPVVGAGPLRDPLGSFLRVPHEGGLEGTLDGSTYVPLSGEPVGLLGFSPGLDLTGDGDATDGLVASDDLKLLPARISLSWLSAGGSARRLDAHVYFSEH